MCEIRLKIERRMPKIEPLPYTSSSRSYGCFGRLCSERHLRADTPTTCQSKYDFCETTSRSERKFDGLSNGGFDATGIEKRRNEFRVERAKIQPSRTGSSVSQDASKSKNTRFSRSFASRKKRVRKNFFSSWDVKIYSPSFSIPVLTVPSVCRCDVAMNTKCPFSPTILYALIS